MRAKLQNNIRNRQQSNHQPRERYRWINCEERKRKKIEILCIHVLNPVDTSFKYVQHWNLVWLFSISNKSGTLSLLISSLSPILFRFCLFTERIKRGVLLSLSLLSHLVPHSFKMRTNCGKCCYIMKNVRQSKRNSMKNAQIIETCNVMKWLLYNLIHISIFPMLQMLPTHSVSFSFSSSSFLSISILQENNFFIVDRIKYFSLKSNISNCIANGFFTSFEGFFFFFLYWLHVSKTTSSLSYYRISLSIRCKKEKNLVPTKRETL